MSAQKSSWAEVTDFIEIGIHAENSHPCGVKLRDKQGNDLMVCFPIKIEINEKGIFADLRVRLHELHLEGAQATVKKEGTEG